MSLTIIDDIVRQVQGQDKNPGPTDIEILNIISIDNIIFTAKTFRHRGICE